ncbi:MAG: hypothetical protein AB1782_07155 [Cyanobacteriota bacterium]
MNLLKGYLALFLSIIVVVAILQLSNAEVYHSASNTASNSSNNNIERNSKNPMKYDYVAKYGDYIKDLDQPYKDKFSGKSWHTHFLRFPITYWISPCREEQRKQILDALAQYATYFPLQEVKSKSQAFLVIEVVDKEELKQLCGKTYKPNVLGCGGGSYSASQLGGNTGRIYKGYLYLKTNIFAIPGSITTVLHELGHAFGIAGHSKDPSDIMYYAIDAWALMSKSSSAKKIPTHLNYRDCNTLYLIYNDWYDK